MRTALCNEIRQLRYLAHRDWDEYFCLLSTPKVNLFSYSWIIMLRSFRVVLLKSFIYNSYSI